MSPPAQLHRVPVDLDVRVVSLPLGQLTDAVHERKRLREITERELSLQSTLNDRVTVRQVHVASIALVSRSAQSGQRRRTMSRIPLLIAGVATMLVLAAPSAGMGVTKLTGTVGPGFTITLKKGSATV